MLIDKLEKLDLSEKEARVYLALLELGESGMERVAEKAGLKRTTAYDLVDSLKEKGLIKLVPKGKRTLYLAQDPRVIEEKYQEKINVFKGALPELLSVANFLDRKPKITYYEDLEGIKEIYRDVLKYPDREIIGWWANRYDYDVVNDEFFTNDYAPKRIANKIWVRGIAPNTPEIHKYKEKEKERLHNLHLVPFDENPLMVEISMYGGNKVSLISYEEKMGIIIESSKLFMTLKSIFEMQWKSLEKE